MRGRRGIAAGTILIAVIALVCAMRLSDGDAPSAAEQAIGRTLPEVNFSNTPLDEALSGLARLGGAPVVVDQAALYAAGIDPTEPVDLRLTGVTFHHALGHVLDYVSSNYAEHLAHTLHRGQIIVTPEGSLGRYVYARVYDVRDIKDPPEWESTIPVHPPASGLFGGSPAGVAAPVTREQRGDEVARLIPDVVDTDVWLDAGGTRGSIQVLGGRLLVVTDWATHRRIDDLLHQLRHPRPAGKED